MESSSISLDNVHAFIFDFDGVLTNNMVFLSESGEESVVCSRSDGLAFDVLRKIGKQSYILSTEKNPVVSARAKKLKVPVLQGVSNKLDSLNKLADKNGYDLKNIIYVGNDLNDYSVMQSCGYTACPSDSHKEIKKISKIVLNTKGGHGVVRELLESVFDIDFIKILQDK